MDDEHLYKSHDKTLLIYHLVFPLKYRKNVITDESGKTLTNVCEEISERYEIEFIEIGYESNHVHFLVQSVSKMSVSKMVRTIKSIIAREMFHLHPEIKSLLWGGSFWISRFYANTVGLYAVKEVIQKYVQNQSKEKEEEYKKIHSGQLKLF
ncbi:IS200/IS605 family transposase [Psychroflexus sp. MES1-P1E]|uniref:IS200/IS605 family transposase n=1 Tax=Psychroflexus sp. MES1-P1E TaxID=2058320 RepID=UPI000C7D8E7F|nr:IS200/IS605 family transposase [Psychroflexus sp. MES1-P1E]PKG43679.1 IS200/IS605 family transposase [Psychroflexus sp. MES1-P1E]